MKKLEVGQIWSIYGITEHGNTVVVETVGRECSQVRIGSSNWRYRVWNADGKVQASTIRHKSEYVVEELELQAERGNLNLLTFVRDTLSQECRDGKLDKGGE